MHIHTFPKFKPQRFMPGCLLFLLSFSVCRAQWVNIAEPKGGAVQSFTAIDGNLFAGTSEGVSRSDDNGASWTPVNSGLSAAIWSLAASGARLFAGTWGSGLYQSPDKGTSWIKTNSGMSDSIVIRCIAFNGADLLVGTDRGLFRSSDKGASWTPAAGFPAFVSITSIAEIGADFFAATWGSGMYRSSDNGASWDLASDGLPAAPEIMAIVVRGTNLFAAIGNKGVYRSSNNGASWTRTIAGMTDSTRIMSLAVGGGFLFAGALGEGVYRSSDDGADWVPVNTGLPRNCRTNALFINGADFFAGTFDGLWKRPLAQMTSSILPHQDAAASGFDGNLGRVIRAETKIGFEVGHQGMVDLSVYDTKGKKTATLMHSELKQGSHEAVFDAEGSPEGIYFLRLASGGLSHTRRFIFGK